MTINANYSNLKDSYLFSSIARKVREYRAANPDADVIRMGIGDVTRPLAPAVTAAMAKAVEEMGDAATFRGYCDGEERGYLFLRKAIIEYYAKKGVALDEDEIYVGDGAKSDLGNIIEIFGQDSKVLIPDPVYPVYVDTNVMAGREILFADGNEANGFLPMPDENVKADIIYLCSPNNPTGAVYNKQQLKAWVDYANANDAVILFDAAYEVFIKDVSLPSSIFEIDGARTCAIEICSFSKTAGFTGVRCGYVVVPAELERGGVSIGKLWLRRQTTKFNGLSYITQAGAAGAFSPEGLVQTRADIAYYMENARIITDALSEMGIWYVGGANAPYIWFKCPRGMGSWEFFDYLLNRANVVGTPGAGFGNNGEGFMRLTAFGVRENVERAVERFRGVM